MYFCIPNDIKKIENHFFGYKLGEHGGNYVEMVGNKIKFSFHKDFKLYKNNSIVLTNLEIDGEELPNDIIEYDLETNEFKRYVPNIGVLTYDVVISKVTDILLENIKTCAKLSDPKIVYTAGLDSSTLAYIAQHNNIDFTCLVQDKYEKKFKLPFVKLKYYQLQDLPDFPINLGRMDNIKPGFYQPENNNLITGYYGDNTILHHKELYHQTKHLCNVEVELYDLTGPAVSHLLNSKDDIVNSVMYINTQNYFRQWFPNFQILDPYRDPRLFEVVLSLPLKELIEQFGSAKIQKDIIHSINNEWLTQICDHKNDYSKF